MHYKSIINALIMSCNVPYNAMYDLRVIVTTVIIHLIIILHLTRLKYNALKHMTCNQLQMCRESANIIMHYNVLYE